MSFRALPGFRDFFPEEMSVRRHIEGAWRAAAHASGFQEIEGPPEGGVHRARVGQEGEPAPAQALEVLGDQHIDAGAHGGGSAPGGGSQDAGDLPGELPAKLTWVSPDANRDASSGPKSWTLR